MQSQEHFAWDCSSVPRRIADLGHFFHRHLKDQDRWSAVFLDLRISSYVLVFTWPIEASFVSAFCSRMYTKTASAPWKPWSKCLQSLWCYPCPSTMMRKRHYATSSKQASECAVQEHSCISKRGSCTFLRCSRHWDRNLGRDELLGEPQNAVHPQNRAGAASHVCQWM